MTEPSEEKNSQPRLYGAIFMIIGLGLIYVGIILPIQQANTGVTGVRFYIKGMMVGIFCTILGLTLLIFGSHTPMWGEADDNPRTAGYYISLAFFVAMGLGTYTLVKGWLASKGYISG